MSRNHYLPSSLYMSFCVFHIFDVWTSADNNLWSSGRSAFSTYVGAICRSWIERKYTCGSVGAVFWGRLKFTMAYFVSYEDTRGNNSKCKECLAPSLRVIWVHLSRFPVFYDRDRVTYIDRTWGGGKPSFSSHDLSLSLIFSLTKT